MTEKSRNDDTLERFNRRWNRRFVLYFVVAIPVLLLANYGLALAGHPTAKWGMCDVLSLC